MPLIANLRHLETHVVRLQGKLSVEELDIDTRDEAIRVAQPLEYDLAVQKLDKGLLLQGWLRLPLDCVCVRCLRLFQHCVELDGWVCHLALQGEDPVAVVNDCVDLTPYIRDDILLEFPRHPQCEPGCCGLPKISTDGSKSAGETGKTEKGLSAWAELNKLKL